MFLHEFITDATFDRMITGASTLTLEVEDYDRKLLDSKLIKEASRASIDKLDFVLAQVRKQGNKLTLVFEDWAVAELRKKKGAKKAFRDTTTRAQFIERLVKEVPGLKYYSPEKDVVQPIEPAETASEESADDPEADGVNGRDRGFPRGTPAGITIEGVPATRDQVDNIEQVINLGLRLRMPERVIESAVATILTESRARNLPGGDEDSVGLFQQRPSQGWPATRDINIDGTEYYKRALRTYENNLSVNKTVLEIHVLSQMVQRSYANTPGPTYGENYRRFEPETLNIMDLFFGGDGVDTGFDQVTYERYEFTRGTEDDPNEDSWTCMQRLAEEVQWRCFAVGKTIYFVRDLRLLKNKPLATIAEFSDGVDYIDFDYDVGKKVSSGTVYGRASRWAVPPGAIFLLEHMGPANGRFIVSSIRRAMYKTATEISFVGPRPTLPEPTPDEAVSNDPGVGDPVSGVGADRVLNWALARVPEADPNNGYVYGAKHNRSLSEMRTTTDDQPPFDCSSFVAHAWAQVGVYIGDYTQAQISLARATEGVVIGGASVSPQIGRPEGGWIAGDLIFPHSGHVMMATGRADEVVEAQQTSVGIVIRQDRIPSMPFFWCRWGAKIPSQFRTTDRSDDITIGDNPLS